VPTKEEHLRLVRAGLTGNNQVSQYENLESGV